MLERVADDLWAATQPLRYLGVALTSRMTVIRLERGDLFVHSPVRLSDELQSAISNLGPVRFIVAPNRFHHLAIPQWQQAYPDAQTFGAPGLDTKQPHLKINALLADDPPAAWAGEIDQTWMRAFPPLNEIVFLHRKSRTLLFTDLLFNIPRCDSSRGRILLSLDGAFRGPAIPRSFKLILRFKRSRCADFLDLIRSWDFDRVIVGHGAIIETGGKNAIARAWSFARP